MMLKIKKILALFAFVFVFANATYANINKSFDANIESKRLDVGTCLNLQLVNQINTDNILIGDAFQAVLKNDLKEEHITLSAQYYIKNLYSSLGFKEISPIYDECNIPHVKMRL